MSDNIPFEIQAKIMKLLPVRSLLTFRSVCKAGKSHIDGFGFIRHYRGDHHQQHILVSVEDSDDYERKYVLIADDDTFPRNKVSLTIPILLRNPRIIGSSHGLLCLLGGFEEEDSDTENEQQKKCVIWNLLIRKAVAVVMPYLKDEGVLGFGVCRETNDSKIVRLTLTDTWQVEVFTLSTGSWRSLCNSLLRESVRFYYEEQVFVEQAIVDGILYFLGDDEITVDGENERYNLIISFDITSEEFGEVNLPTSLTHETCYFLRISKLRESLVLLDYAPNHNNPIFGVWRLEDGDRKAFSKLFNISDNASLGSYFWPLGFRKTGEAIIEYMRNHERLFGYVPYSNCITNLGINGRDYCYVHPYMETLLLLDQSNLTVYDGM